MLNSVLLHLENASQAEAVIRLGIAVALPAEATVRGLTLLDTRHVASAQHCESAVFLVAEQTRQNVAQREQHQVRASLTQACLDARLNFDVRRASGDPLDVLAQEARFHDLLVTSLADPGWTLDAAEGLSFQELLALLERGVQPLLAVHRKQRLFERVLLVYDGSEASGRAIRSFLGLINLPAAEHRLLAIGPDQSQARELLREMADYCVKLRPAIETGCLGGRLRQVLPPYAEKWQADLVVMGTSRPGWRCRGLFGNAAADLWRQLPCGLFIAT